MPQQFVKTNDSDMRIIIPNGAVIECRSGEKPDALFGEGVWGVVIDEASRFREQSWHAIRTTLTQTKGKMRIISKPKGKKNWFYKLCLEVKAGKHPDAAYFHMTTADNPTVTQEEIESAQRILPRRVFEEMYLGIAQEDAAGVFTNVQECIGSTLRPPEPMQSYITGVDLGKQKSFTTVATLDREGNLVAFDRWRRVEWSLTKKKIVAHCEAYNDSALLIDSTGVGDPIYEDIAKILPNVQGYKFTAESKRVLIEGLAVAFENRAIRIANIEELLFELDVFEYQVTPSGNITYGAPEGYDDDCVIALSLAWRGLSEGVLGITPHDLRDVEFAPSVVSRIERY